MSACCSRTGRWYFDLDWRYCRARSRFSDRRNPLLHTHSDPISTLVDPVTRSVKPTSRWSSAIAQRYALELSPQWVQWFDQLAPEGMCDGEFCEPAHPEVLLDATPEVIWPGLMPPDLLPVVGNALGDWLCARVGADNTIAEVVYWYHGGGDCLPYGNSIAEAMVYDALATRFPGRARSLAIPAQLPPQPVRGPLLDRPAIRWALQHLPPAVAEVFEPDFPVPHTAARLLQCGVAQIAIRCDLVLAALDNEVRRRMTPPLAALLDARWEQDVVQWMFDPSSMPPAVAQRLAEHWQLPPQQWQQQDWELAVEHCQRVADSRSDLAWAHDILGWAAQRKGDRQEAIDHYRRGALASLFTDQAVRFRTHFDSDRYGKFAVARLADLEALTLLDPAYVQTLAVHASPVDREATGWRESVCRYWLRKAHTTAAAAERYQYIYRAGWDVGCDSIRCYEHLLTELAVAAEAAGQSARAQLARAHRDCLRGRYLID